MQKAMDTAVTAWRNREYLRNFGFSRTYADRYGAAYIRGYDFGELLLNSGDNAQRLAGEDAATDLGFNYVRPEGWAWERGKKQ